jgi:hypothetical protein
LSVFRSFLQSQAAFPENTALIEYVRYLHYLGKSKFEFCYGAVVFATDAPPRWVTLGSAKEIEAALRRYQSSARPLGDADEMAAILQKLYHEVWEPIQRALEASAKTVIISPDGQLNFLSFATLLDGEKRFVAEKYSIRYVASGRDLLRKFKSRFISLASAFSVRARILIYISIIAGTRFVTFRNAGFRIGTHPIGASAPSRTHQGRTSAAWCPITLEMRNGDRIEIPADPAKRQSQRRITSSAANMV